MRLLWSVDHSPEEPGGEREKWGEGLGYDSTPELFLVLCGPRGVSEREGGALLLRNDPENLSPVNLASASPRFSLFTVRPVFSLHSETGE